MALSDAGRWALDPGGTVPKARLVGLTAKSPPIAEVAVPIPESGILTVPLGALETIARFPLTLPANCGVNVTLNFRLFPAPRVTG